ncbi:unnamed protein product, partial [Ectocarpus fasciculatus]
GCRRGGCVCCREYGSRRQGDDAKPKVRGSQHDRVSGEAGTAGARGVETSVDDVSLAGSPRKRNFGGVGERGHGRGRGCGGSGKGGGHSEGNQDPREGRHRSRMGRDGDKGGRGERGRPPPVGEKERRERWGCGWAAKRHAFNAEIAFRSPLA